MFGEYESESPRVPSPWDSLISSPRSLSPSQLACQSNGNATAEPIFPSVSPRYLSPSPLLLPRLVPENDTGNIEYKLQLLNPSPARFARLVTQLKWRLLEGGGQAYYELGVADSGDLVGLEREQLESSLDTLEMMAGEIGASVIVVKEIEVPAELAVRYAEDIRNGGSWGDTRGKRDQRGERSLMGPFTDDGDSIGASSYTNTESEDDSAITDDGDYGDMQMTIVLQQTAASNTAPADLAEPGPIFVMDSEPDCDAAEAVDISESDEEKLIYPPSQYAIDLEISSVYKPRPMQKRFHHVHPSHQYHHSNGQGRMDGKRGKRVKEKFQVHYSDKEPLLHNDDTLVPPTKSLPRKKARDRRREEKKQTLLTMAAREATDASNGVLPSANEVDTLNAKSVLVETEILSEQLKALHVDVGPSPTTHRTSESITTSSISTNPDDTSTATMIGRNTSVVPKNKVSDTGTTIRNGGGGFKEVEDDGEVFVAPVVVTPELAEVERGKRHTRLIVEVLVVRKMSMEEGFLDFEGFSLV